MRYFIVAVVLLSCWCKNSTVLGVEEINNKEAPPPAHALPAEISSNSAQNASTAKPKLLVQPRIALPRKPVDEPFLLGKPVQMNLDSAKPPQVLPAVSTADAVNNLSTAKPKLMVQPRILVPNKPVNEPGLSKPVLLEKPVQMNLDSPKEPQVLPAISTADTVKNSPKNETTVTADNIKADENPKPCAHTMCPMIYCQNNLPAIPSRGICCLRCINNPKCNTSACPKLKCGADLIPANITAGECCDHCPPVTDQSTVAPKTTAVPKKHSKKPKQITPSTSSSSSSEDSGERSSSSSEEPDEKPLGCNIRPFHSKSKRHYSRLIRLLTKTLAHFRHSHPHRRHAAFGESQEH